MIAIHLPRVESFKIKGSIDRKTHIDNKYSLDLTGFSNLKKFSIDIGSILDGVTDPKFAYFKLTDSDIIHCYEIDKSINTHEYSFKVASGYEYKVKDSPFSSSVFIHCCRFDKIDIYAQSCEPIAKLRFGKLISA